MAFLIHSTDDGRIPSHEYLPCSAITPKVGMALMESSGKLAIATGKNKPTYISMTERSAAVTAGEIIPVIRVDHDIIFETTFSATATSIKIGDKVTLHASSGMQVTATTSETSGQDTVLIGVAEVVWMEGTASGSRVRVRF